MEVKTAEAVLFGETIMLTPNLPSRAPDTLRFSITENPPSRSLIKFIKSRKIIADIGID